MNSTDPLVRWNVGYASEWDAAIRTTEDVEAALRQQADDNGWEVDEDQLINDAYEIADWLVEERGN